MNCSGPELEMERDSGGCARSYNFYQAPKSRNRRASSEVFFI